MAFDADTLNKSVSKRIHTLAVANVDILFERATVHEEYDDNRGDESIKKMHHFGGVLKDGDTYYPVKLTVKEFKRTAEKNRVYSIEAIDIDKKKSAGHSTATDGNDGRHIPHTDFMNSLQHIIDFVNSNSIAIQKIFDSPCR